MDLKGTIYKYYENQASEYSPRRLGASIIGHECDKFIWLNFRWAQAHKYDGRTLKIFRRGHDEEDNILKVMKESGIDVEYEDKEGNQISFSGLWDHFGGRVDGVITNESCEKYLLEIKTHNDKSFKRVVKNGVEKSKPQHYAQMQTYMGLMQVEKGIYLCINKNDEDIYVETVDFCKDDFLKLKNKATQLIFNKNIPPEGIGNREDFFKCKYCPSKPVCFKKELPRRNCRTCCHSTPDKSGWTCTKHDISLTHDKQIEGCTDHRYIPPLIGVAIDYVGEDVYYSSGYIDKGI